MNNITIVLAPDGSLTVTQPVQQVVVSAVTPQVTVQPAGPPGPQGAPVVVSATPPVNPAPGTIWVPTT